MELLLYVHCFQTCDWQKHSISYQKFWWDYFWFMYMYIHNTRTFNIELPIYSSAAREAEVPELSMRKITKCKGRWEAQKVETLAGQW